MVIKFTEKLFFLCLIGLTFHSPFTWSSVNKEVIVRGKIKNVSQSQIQIITGNGKILWVKRMYLPKEMKPLSGEWVHLHLTLDQLAQSAHKN